MTASIRANIYRKFTPAPNEEPLRSIVIITAIYLIAALPFLIATSSLTLVLAVILASSLTVATYHDLRTFLIPDWCSLSLLLLGLLTTWLTSPPVLGLHALGATLGYASLAIVAFLYRRFRGHDGLGLGDAKLLAAGGAWVGPGLLTPILLIASIAAIVAILFKGPGVGDDVDGEGRAGIAFGPYLALAIWLVWLYGDLITGVRFFS